MKTAPDEILMQIRSVIDRYRWADLAEAASLLKDGPKPGTLLLVADRTLDISKFQEWVHGQRPEFVIQFADLEELKTNAYRPFETRKTLVVFEYGALISSLAEEVVNRSIHKLPAGSFGFVFQAPNATDFLLEFERIVMGARRVLAPKEIGPFNPERLSSLGIYFWSKKLSTEAGLERISGSVFALRAWLDSPFVGADKFARAGLDNLIAEVLERLLCMRETKMSKGSDLSRSRLTDVIAQLRELEGRIRMRWKSDIEVAAKRAEATIAKAKAGCLAAVSDAGVQRELSAAEAKDVPALLERSLRAHLRRAHEEWTAGLDKQLDVVRVEMDELVASQDWKEWSEFINDQTPVPMGLGPCPTPNIWAAQTVTPRLEESSWRRPPEFDGQAMAYAGVGALVGGGCTAGLAALLRCFIHFGIARLALAGGAGAVLGGVTAVAIDRRLKRAGDLKSESERFVTTFMDAWQQAAGRETRLLMDEPAIMQWIAKLSAIRSQFETVRDGCRESEQLGASESDLRLLRSLAERNRD